VETGISQSNTAKLINKMVQSGWLEVSKRDPKTSMKTITIAFDGQMMLTKFEEVCQEAIRAIPKGRTSRVMRAGLGRRRRRPTTSLGQTMFKLKDIPKG
jgi:hypothetical protein